MSGVKISKLAIDGPLLITPARHTDDRGYFAETYNEKALAGAGLSCRFVQDNCSYSAKAGTVRGLHYQAPPFAQAKLVRVVRGSILDVAVDARKTSPAYGKWVSAELSAKDGAQLFVPAGFLHGFVTLEPDTQVAYKVDAYYDRASDGAVKWDDPDLAIAWGVNAGAVVISEKDDRAQSWAAFKSPF